MSGTNITIDDQDSSVQLVYDGPWTPSIRCIHCAAIPPDINQVHSRTWNDALYTVDSASQPFVQLTFTGAWIFHRFPLFSFSIHFLGTAVYVYGITINDTSDIIVTNQNLDFEIDGQNVGNFVFSPSGPDYNYNVNFLAKSGLSPDSHILKMTLQKSSFVLLDYFVVTSIGYVCVSYFVADGT